MNYTFTNPCPKCPFRNDIKPYLNADRVEEICESDSFACHQTTVANDCSDDGELEVTNKSQMCAGYMILREKMDQPSQMMRIAERIGLYKRKNLNMKAPVYEDVDEMMEAQEQAD